MGKVYYAHRVACHPLALFVAGKRTKAGIIGTRNARFRIGDDGP